MPIRTARIIGAFARDSTPIGKFFFRFSFRAKSKECKRTRKRRGRLIEPELAHRIQRDKVLAFFDLFVANRPGARARLLADNHADGGLELEHRNF